MNPEHKRNALLRLKTIHGHTKALIGMVEAETYCPDVMKQIAAVQASLERVNRVLLENHLETCVTDAIQGGSGKEKIRELIDSLRYNGGLTDFRHASSRTSDKPEQNGRVPAERAPSAPVRARNA